MRILTRFLGAVMALLASAATASPVSGPSQDRLSRGLATWVVVEFNAADIDRDAASERLRRGLRFEDDAIQALRRDGYGRLKRRVAAAATGPDVGARIDYAFLPLQAWQVSSPSALSRLRAAPGVLRVHNNSALRPVSVSDLGFIRQPQTALAGGTGAGTTVAVIDGGLGPDAGKAYLAYPDFGPCTAVGTPATCRVLLDRVTYPDQSSGSNHGTSVSAIALGTASQARLANYDVFQGSSASTADILSAINHVLSIRSTYNVVAINMSLGDGSSNTTPCTDSAFAGAIAIAKYAGILTVVAAGNSGSKSGLSDPACVPEAVSVGAVHDDKATGTWQWHASAATGGTCTQTASADVVTCFSQSSPFLSLLAPGTFVAAPDAANVSSGTSQAAPHVTGAVAVLRARFPSESLSTTLQRLQTGGVSVTDPANGRQTPRLDLFGALQLGTSLSLSGQGPTAAVAGSSTPYTVTVANGGPLIATNLAVRFTIPTGASFGTGTTGCTAAGRTVTCLLASLNAGASATFTVTLNWSVNASPQITASVSADQTNSAPAPQQTAMIGGSSSLSTDGDAPLPIWAWVMLAAILGWRLHNLEEQRNDMTLRPALPRQPKAGQDQLP